MANLRNLKKEIDYRLEEVVFDCDMAICFQPSKEKEIFEVMQEAVGVRNDLFAKAMNPAEPHNPSLVRKHYAALRAEMDALKGDGGSSWGNQMRSYVLHPYQMVKDLRTGVTSPTPDDVLDGDLDPFMAAALSQRVSGEAVAVEDVD